MSPGQSQPHAPAAVTLACPAWVLFTTLHAPAGKWKDADPQEVEDMLKKGTPHCFRCRVPVNQEIIVPDLVRGSVTFNSNSVGDFICLRSDGTPVYVSVDPCY